MSSIKYVIIIWFYV